MRYTQQQEYVEKKLDSLGRDETVRVRITGQSERDYRVLCFAMHTGDFSKDDENRTIDVDLTASLIRQLKGLPILERTIRLEAVA